MISESKYGYIGSGISDVFERYYEMFNDNTWNLLFENIVTRFAESDYGIIASLWGDFTIFSIYYLSRIDKDKIKALFDCLCKTHESLSSANGRVKIKEPSVCRCIYWADAMGIFNPRKFLNFVLKYFGEKRCYP